MCVSISKDSINSNTTTTTIVRTALIVIVIIRLLLLPVLLQLLKGRAGVVIDIHLGGLGGGTCYIYLSDRTGAQEKKKRYFLFMLLRILHTYSYIYTSTCISIWTRMCNGLAEGYKGKNSVNLKTCTEIDEIHKKRVGRGRVVCIVWLYAYVCIYMYVFIHLGYFSKVLICFSRCTKLLLFFHFF